MSSKSPNNPSENSDRSNSFLRLTFKTPMGFRKQYEVNMTIQARPKVKPNFQSILITFCYNFIIASTLSLPINSIYDSICFSMNLQTILKCSKPHHQALIFNSLSVRLSPIMQCSIFRPLASAKLSTGLDNRFEFFRQITQFKCQHMCQPNLACCNNISSTTSTLATIFIFDLKQRPQFCSFVTKYLRGQAPKRSPEGWKIATRGLRIERIRKSVEREAPE